MVRALNCVKLALHSSWQAQCRSQVTNVPRYHFHVETRSGPSSDIEGHEIADDTAAVQEARNAVVGFLRDDMLRGYDESYVVVAVDRNDGTKVALIKASTQVETF